MNRWIKWWNDILTGLSFEVCFLWFFACLFDSLLRGYLLSSKLGLPQRATSSTIFLLCASHIFLFLNSPIWPDLAMEYHNYLITFYLFCVCMCALACVGGQRVMWRKLSFSTPCWQNIGVIASARNSWAISNAGYFISSVWQLGKLPQAFRIVLSLPH